MIRAQKSPLKFFKLGYVNFKTMKFYNIGRIFVASQVLWVQKFGQVGESPSKFQNHPRGEASRKIMLNFKNELHPGSQIFQKVASNLIKLENRQESFKITLEERPSEKSCSTSKTSCTQVRRFFKKLLQICSKSICFSLAYML